MAIPKSADPASTDKNAQAMADMMLKMMSNIKLRIGEGNTYKISMMGMPLEGHYAINGNMIHFVPEKAAGKTADEWRKLDSSGRGSTTPEMQPTDALLSSDAQTITFLNKDDPKAQGLVFRRVAVIEEKSRLLTVSGDVEKQLVGHFDGTIVIPQSEKDRLAKGDEKERQAAEAAQMMMESMDLDLHQDNTFEMNMMVDLAGTWKVSGNQIILTTTASADAQSQKPREMAFTISPDGKTISARDPKGESSIVFTKDQP